MLANSFCSDFTKDSHQSLGLLPLNTTFVTTCPAFGSGMGESMISTLHSLWMSASFMVKFSCGENIRISGIIEDRTIGLRLAVWSNVSLTILPIMHVKTLDV